MRLASELSYLVQKWRWVVRYVNCEPCPVHVTPLTLFVPSVNSRTVKLESKVYQAVLSISACLLVLCLCLCLYFLYLQNLSLSFKMSVYLIHSEFFLSLYPVLIAIRHLYNKNDWALYLRRLCHNSLLFYSSSS